MNVPQAASLNALSSPMQPLAADMRVRKSISDSCLQRGLPVSYHNVNMNFLLMNRSGSRTIKQIIATINESCDQMQQPPLQEINILAHFAPDSFYRIVISGKQGLEAILRAMQTFPNCRDLQECGCLALGNLCIQNNNLVIADQAGAVPTIIAAMRLHPTSVAVQSAACEALRNMSPLLLVYAKTQTSLPGELMTALSNTSTLNLLPLHRQIADALLQLVGQAAQCM